MFWNIWTTHRDRGGLAYDVYLYSNTRLAACVPPRTGASLLKRFPDAFTLHQDAEDAKVLLFEEERLHGLADVLRLRRKRKVSEQERHRLAEMGRQHSQEGLRKLAELRSASVRATKRPETGRSLGQAGQKAL